MIETLSNYILSDGEILSFKIEYPVKSVFDSHTSYAILELKVRIPKPKNKWESCTIRLRFSELVEIKLFEDFGTGANYSDITLIQTVNKEYYLSLDPYSNQNEPDEKDNFVIRAKKLEVEEIM